MEMRFSSFEKYAMMTTPAPTVTRDIHTLDQSHLPKLPMVQYTMFARASLSSTRYCSSELAPLKNVPTATPDNRSSTAGTPFLV